MSNFCQVAIIAAAEPITRPSGKSAGRGGSGKSRLLYLWPLVGFLRDIFGDARFLKLLADKEKYSETGDKNAKIANAKIFQRYLKCVITFARCLKLNLVKCAF